MKKIICETGSGMKKYIIGWRACQLRHPKMKWGWKVAKIILILLVVKLFIGMIVGLVVMVRMDKLVEKSPQKTMEVIMPAVNVPDIESFVLVSGATITGYTASPAETDNEPCITADGTNICGTTEKIVANNCLPFDTLIKYGGDIYRVADRMNRRYGCEVYDLLFEERQDALNWGVKTNQTIKIL